VKRLSIKAKQVAGVTSIVGLSVVVLSAIHLAWLARVKLEESSSRGRMLANAVYQRAREAVTGQSDPYEALRKDAGIRSILESSIAYSNSVTYAAIVDGKGLAVAHSFPALEGQPLPPQDDLDALLTHGALAQLRAVYADRTLEVTQPLLMGDRQFGSIRMGVSPLLIRSDLREALQPALALAALALAIALAGSSLLAQWLLRPIHVIRSGLTRIGRGEVGVTLGLPPGDEFGELGRSFDAMSAELTAQRSRAALPGARVESVVERLEDAVAIFNRDGELLFANATMRAATPDVSRVAEFDAEDPRRTLVEATLAAGQSQGPIRVPDAADAGSGERLLACHAIEDAEQGVVGAMLVVRDIAYLSQVQSTINYSRKLAALGRLMAGVAHEVKNPLNAMTIHLELLKRKLGAPKKVAEVVGAGPLAVEAGPSGATVTVTPAVSDRVAEHVEIIAGEIRRLDQVVQGFLKFSRPEELRLEPVDLTELVEEVVRLVTPQADTGGIAIAITRPSSPAVANGDVAMLRQMLMNLALNACDAMPRGGTLTITSGAAAGRRVELRVEDTGTGIKPEHLERIFDLYFTTKPHGSGIGLSMVFRIVQMHDGDVEVTSTLGAGTTFRVLLPQA
jgi:signal transduction histidine kinase